MAENKQPDARKRKNSDLAGQKPQNSNQQSVPLTHIPTPKYSNQRAPLSDLLTPPPSKRVSLAEILTCKFLYV